MPTSTTTLFNNRCLCQLIINSLIQNNNSTIKIHHVGLLYIHVCLVEVVEEQSTEL